MCRRLACEVKFSRCKIIKHKVEQFSFRINDIHVLAKCHSLHVDDSRIVLIKINSPLVCTGICTCTIVIYYL